MARDYLPFAREYAPYAVGDKGRGQEHIDGEMIDKSKPCTDMELTDRYKHRYSTVYGPCLFSVGKQIGVVSWFSLVVQLSGRQRFIH